MEGIRFIALCVAFIFKYFIWVSLAILVIQMIAGHAFAYEDEKVDFVSRGENSEGFWASIMLQSLVPLSGVILNYLADQ